MALQLSFSELVKRAANLELEEYEKFISSVNKLRAKHQSGRASGKENKLLTEINKGFPVEKWQRMRALDAKMEASSLAKEEHDELASLTEAYEEFTLRRLQLLKQLALLRNLSLEETMNQMGLQHGQV